MSDGIQVGDGVDLTVEFRNSSGVLTDPTDVVLQLRTPTGTTSQYKYSTAGVTRVSTGIFTRRVTASEPLLWMYRFIGSGALSAGTGDLEFPVDPTVFSAPT
jgi:hypothetical protein